ncbi:MAG: hypothetical protein ACI4JB_01055 [Porcipelethomonas sp.]
MNFYGVGVRFGKSNSGSILDKCLSENCWYMGFTRGENARYDKLIENVTSGDIVFVKSYPQGIGAEFKIEAVGIVTEKKLPEKIRQDYEMGFSVIWFKVFEFPISFTSKEVKLGGRKPDTIYHEKDEDMIEKIKEIMKYNYREERLS